MIRLFKYIILLLLLVSIPANAGRLQYLLGAGSQPSGTSCTLYDSHETGNDLSKEVARYNASELVGVLWNDSVQSNDICQVDWHINTSPGSPSNNDYYCEIWSISGTAIDALQGRSDKVDGDDDWSVEFISFSFNTSVAVAQGSDFAIVLKAIDSGDPAGTVGEYDATNFITLGIDNENNGTAKMAGSGSWDSVTKVRTVFDAEDDVLCRIHTE
jgi:hypothetical protein